MTKFKKSLGALVLAATAVTGFTATPAMAGGRMMTMTAITAVTNATMTGMIVASIDRGDRYYRRGDRYYRGGQPLQEQAARAAPSSVL